MRVNLFCCFKSPTTDDDSSQSSSSASRQNSISISAPIQPPVRPPVVALGAEVRVAPVPEIFVERAPYISNLGTPERAVSRSPQSLSPQPRSAASSLQVSPTPSRATYVAPSEIASRKANLQEDLIRARAKLINTGCKASIELQSQGQEPPYIQVLGNLYDEVAEHFYDDGDGHIYEDPDYESVDEVPNPRSTPVSATNPIAEDDTYMGVYVNQLGLAAFGSDPSIFQLIIDLEDADQALSNGRPQTIAQATALTPPPARRITAAEVLGVPDEYGLGTGQFGDGSYSIG